MLEYEFTVTDNDTWASPWTVNLPMVKNDLPMFEYACHEGNYSMPQMLGGARALESEAQPRSTMVTGTAVRAGETPFARIAVSV